MTTEIKPSSERKCTNIQALVFAIVFLALTVILVTYCGIAALIRHKSIENRDRCGNICGQLNFDTYSDECGDPDKRAFPKLLMKIEGYYDHTHEKCIESCPHGYTDIGNACYEDDSYYVHQTSYDDDMGLIIKSLKATWYYILMICFVAFIFSYIFLILFRHAATFVIWVINIGFIIGIFALAFWMLILDAIPFGIGFGVFGLILAVMLCYYARRIALVGKLFKEASKALIDVPVLMFEPILTFISLVISVLIFATFYVIISFAGDDDPLVGPAHICNFISFIFITQFITGCQNFIIAGTICRWYFTRDKTKLEKPIKKSFSHLFKFHLGSVCFGAILVTLVKLIRMLFAAIRDSARENKNGLVVIIATLLLCLVDIFEELLSYLVANAYIIVAKDGTPFYDSGKRAVKLLTDNIVDVIALNQFGDLVLFACRLIVVLIAGFVGYAVLSQNKHAYHDFITLPLIVGCILAFLIAHCFVMVFEMTVDTIFVSFCIDLEENDGQTKPYYMSDSLKKVIMKMKEYSGGTLTFGPKTDQGIESGLTDESGFPMLPQQPSYPQPMYPNLGYGDPNNPLQYPQQPMYPPQPGVPYPQPGMPYPQQPNVPYYPPPAMPYPDQHLMPQPDKPLMPYPEKPVIPPQGYPATYPDPPKY